MLNDEVEEYLSRNDIIIVPVGTVEMHHATLPKSTFRKQYQTVPELKNTSN